MISCVYSLWLNDYSQTSDIFVIPSYNRRLPLCTVLPVSLCEVSQKLSLIVCGTSDKCPTELLVWMAGHNGGSHVGVESWYLIEPLHPSQVLSWHLSTGEGTNQRKQCSDQHYWQALNEFSTNCPRPEESSILYMTERHGTGKILVLGKLSYNGCIIFYNLFSG